VALPNVTTRETVTPSGGEYRQRIQKAIDKVSSFVPDDEGFRGAVLLKAGTYKVTGTVRIRQSGVVLRRRNRFCHPPLPTWQGPKGRRGN
jgi:polygalacturonase